MGMLVCMAKKSLEVSGEQGAAPWAGEGRRGSTRVLGQEGGHQ